MCRPLVSRFSFLASGLLFLLPSPLSIPCSASRYFRPVETRAFRGLVLCPSGDSTHRAVSAFSRILVFFLPVPLSSPSLPRALRYMIHDKRYAASCGVRYDTKCLRGVGSDKALHRRPDPPCRAAAPSPPSLPPPRPVFPSSQVAPSTLCRRLWRFQAPLPCPMPMPYFPSLVFSRLLSSLRRYVCLMPAPPDERAACLAVSFLVPRQASCILPEQAYGGVQYVLVTYRGHCDADFAFAAPDVKAPGF